jgi:GNAT superfamily N-acetyltransferase
MIDARHATTGDADELMRLRVIMLTGVSGEEPPPGLWHSAGAAILRETIGTAFTVFVVDDPDRPGRLAACAVGTVEQRLPNPANPTGQVGYVFSVATDPRCRRRRYSRACLRALLHWYDARGIAAVDLRASRDGEPLYTALGFARTTEPAMRRIRPEAGGAGA